MSFWNDTGAPQWQDYYDKFQQDHKAQFGIGIDRPWNSDPDAARAKQIIDAAYLQGVQEYNQQTGANIEPDMQMLGADAQPNTFAPKPKGGGVLGRFGNWFEDNFTKPIQGETGNILGTAAAFATGMNYLAPAIAGAEVAALPASQVGALTAPEAVAGYGGATGALAEAAGGADLLPLAATSVGSFGPVASVVADGGLAGLAGAAGAASSWIPGVSNSTLVGVGANALSGLVGSNAAGKAAQAQADAANAASANSLTASREANALQKQMFDKQVSLQEPFRQAGLTGQNRLMDVLGLSGNTGAQGYGSANEKFGDKPFTQDPSYQWRLQQGQQALERSAAARGGLLSGRAAKDTMNYAQGAASQEYGNAFNRFQTERANTLNPLQSLSGMAQTASGAMSNAAGNYGSNVGNNITSTANQVGQNMQGAGSARASGYMGQANVLSGALSGGLNYMQNQNMLDTYMNRRGSQW